MAPKLYIIKASPPVRTVLITAKALGIKLELHEVDFFKQEHLSPAYLKLNPQHTVPTLDDNGTVICESHAITAYLVRKYGKDDSLYPKDFHKRAIVDQRLHFDNGVLYTVLRTVDLGYFRKETTEVPECYVEQIKEGYGFLETFLEGHQWAAGDTVTIADFHLVPNVTSLDYHVKIDPQTYPNITAWLKRARALPCFAGDDENLQSFIKLFNDLKGVE